MPKVFTRKLEQRDIAPLSESFIGTPWERRGTDHFKNLLQSQLDSERIVLVGLIDSKYYIFEPIEIQCCRTENRHDIAK